MKTDQLIIIINTNITIYIKIPNIENMVLSVPSIVVVVVIIIINNRFGHVFIETWYKAIVK